MIYVANKSTTVSDADVQTMCAAVQVQIRDHAAKAWSRQPVAVTFVTDPTSVQQGWVITVMDDSDQAGALGWHTEDQDVVYGRVFARPVLDNGGNALTAQLSVASVLSHEVLETFCDPSVNWWAQVDNTTLIAVEVGDPVESDAYPISINDVPVMVSNFVQPHWFDSQATDQFDFMGRLSAPFTMTSGGYIVKMVNGTVSQQFGEHYPEWRKHTKATPLSRTTKRFDSAVKQ